jgi:hypothetical protein
MPVQKVSAASKIKFNTTQPGRSAPFDRHQSLWQVDLFGKAGGRGGQNLS